MKVQLVVEASCLVDVEMSEEDVAKLEVMMKDNDDPIEIGEVPGINLDDVINQLDIEVSDYNVVRPRKGNEGAKTEEDLCPCECHPNSEGTIASCVHCAPSEA